MDESPIALPVGSLLHHDDGVTLSDRSLGADPSSILIAASDPQTLRFRLIEWLAKSPNRQVKSARKQEVAKLLDITLRQVERLLKQYWADDLQETGASKRCDKGQHRIDTYWQDYIRQVYEKSLKQKSPMKPADVVREVQRHAVIDLHHEEGDYPHAATVYRILNPLVERQKRKAKIRNPGSGSWLAVATRDGKLLKADFSNQIVQCDHTKLDIRIVDGEGNLLRWRPWLTTVVDTFSSCLLGYHLWHKQPGSEEVALTLRHAILPKDYPPDYDLAKPWNIYGPPLQYFFTDGGKDLSRSKHIKAVGKRLGFQCELRDRPNQGGIVERLFKTINTQVLATLPGYIAGKDKELVNRSEKTACLTLSDLDKILAGFFCDDYNHQPYPKDPRDSRFERWLRGMGGELPEPIDPRELDILLLKEEQRMVQAHGSVYFESLTYRCEALLPYRGQYVTLRYDPDHILTLQVYSLETHDQSCELIGHAHAINMDTQDLSLEELKHINKRRNTAKRQQSNYDALLALDKRNKRVEDRKQIKATQQRSEQSKLRKKDKQNSKVVNLRNRRKGKSAKPLDEVELLRDRIDHDQIRSTSPKPSPQPTQPQPSQPQQEERHKLVIQKNQTLKRIW
jgi:putative transposase